MKFSKLLLHMKIMHSTLQKMYHIFKMVKEMRKIKWVQSCNPQNSLNVSSLIALLWEVNHNSKAKKPFIVCEELTLLAAKDICYESWGEITVQMVRCIPFSASTGNRWCNVIADDIEEQMMKRNNESWWYSIQVDESIYVDNSNNSFISKIFQKNMYGVGYVYEDISHVLLMVKITQMKNYWNL